MRKLLCFLLVAVMIASLSAVAFNAAGAGTATITLKGANGESVTKTYAVGDTVTAYSYLNVSQIGEGKNQGKVNSINATQTYDSTVLELADAFDTTEGINYGFVDDLDAMFPIFKQTCVANAGEPGAIVYNASTANGFTFNTDTSAMIVVNYTVIAPGTATIENSITTMAENGTSLTRIVDRGVIKNPNFTTPVALSEPILPIETGYTVSGGFTSFLNTSGITIELLQNGEQVDSHSYEEDKGTYTFENVEAGDYVIRVSKKNHVTRDYVLTVDGDAELAVKIHPKGDISGDGKVTNTDYARANSYFIGMSQLNDYQIKCGDVVKNDGKITNQDVARINSVVCGMSSLWTE